MEIISEEDYIKIINANEHHFKNLFKIVQKCEEFFEGDCMYEHETGIKNDKLIPKQRNLYTIAKTGNKIIEIGFNAGNSALLFLLANPNAYLWCFDICYHSYTKLCFQYLYDNFGQRISLYIGSSVDTVPKFIKNNPDKTYDIFHIDGSHDSHIANQDFFNCFSIAHHQSIIILDDVWIVELKKLWESYIAAKMICSINLLSTTFGEHKIGYVWKPKIKIAVCSLTVGEEYKKITKYGRKTKILYCQKHGYDFFDEETDVDYNRPLAWSKINIIKKHLLDYDYIIWIDGDTFIMNDNIKLEEIISDYTNNKDITVARDISVIENRVLINTGVMLIKNTEWVMKFLNLIYDQVQFINHSFWEQAAFLNLLENNISDSQNHINVLPFHLQNKINTYWFTYYYNDCFIFHFPGSSVEKENNLSEKMNKYCPIQMDDETLEKYQKRIYWLEHESRNFIDGEIKRLKKLKILV